MPRKISLSRCSTFSLPMPRIRSNPLACRRRYDFRLMKGQKTGNWTPDGKAERAALRRDFRELTPAQRAEQAMELSRFMSHVAEAGRRRRSG
jgi:hypothetical protein